MMLASLYLLAFAVLSSLFASCLCSEAFKVSQVSSLNRRPRGGPTGLARAYARYGLPVSQSLATSDAGQLKGHISSSSADLVDYEIMYSTPITIGGQKFNMQLDTGSSAVWVYSAFTPEDMRGPNRSVYDPSLSPTSRIIPNVSLVETYGGGSIYVSGLAYTDTLTIGDLVVPSQAVGATENVSSSFYSIPTIDGILGLSAYNGSGGSDLSRERPGNAEGTSLYRLPQSWKWRGFTFGYIPEPYSETTLTWVNSTSDWSTIITGWAIGTPSNMTSTSLGPIVDTGTPFLLLPPDYCTEYYNSVTTVLQGSYHGETGFIYPCNTTLPDLYLKIGEYTATIKGDQIAGPEVGNGYCWGHLQPIAGPNVPSAILGDTFLQSTFTVFKLPAGDFGIR
ncbi:acid protease [Hyaloscypha variabilis F]|uniref:Acid protease n=1 Tax=Hyaloscypha variabilis (strain UAMH 11265 / GT02V1 / F) TaxID=1149755 RepID=A0A2J6RRD7_HYAVF|nr:acid protease [Hyaloscypha variabilis F]